MQRKALIVLASLAAALLLVVSSLLTIGSRTAAAKQTVAASFAAPKISAPKVFNAAQAKKYAGQTITFVGDGVGGGHDRDVALATAFTKATGIHIRILEHPAQSTDAYAQLVRNFSQHSSAIDVMMLDVVWPGAFAPFLYDLKPALGKQANTELASVVKNDTVGGHLVAIPWFGDFGILYYRTDLLKKYGFSHPPKTWAELTAQAKVIQAGEQKANKNFYGFVFQGNAYEGLTCDALEWLASTGGGSFVSGKKATIDNPTAAGMLNLVRGWVGTIAPRGVTSYAEEDARHVFDAGDAAFMRNWPYAYSLSAAAGSPVAGKFAVTVLPHAAGHTPVGTVGGWQLGVSKYSNHIGASIEWVRYISSAPAQRFDAITNTNVPLIASVARDPLVRKTNPYLTPAINNVKRVTRPSSFLKGQYQLGSEYIFQAVNQILNGADAKSVLPGVASKLQRLLDNAH